MPVVTVMLLVRRGAADDPPGKEGLAALTVDMLDEGSGELIGDRDSRGARARRRAARLGHRAGRRAAHGHGRSAASPRRRCAAGRHRGRGRRCVEEDFARVRQLRLHRLMQLRDMPGAVADRAFVRLLYGDHPYGHTPLGSEAGAGRDVTVDDVRDVPRGQPPARRTRR